MKVSFSAAHISNAQGVGHMSAGNAAYRGTGVQKDMFVRSSDINFCAYEYGKDKPRAKENILAGITDIAISSADLLRSKDFPNNKDVDLAVNQSFLTFCTMRSTYRYGENGSKTSVPTQEQFEDIIVDIFNGSRLPDGINPRKFSDRPFHGRNKRTRTEDFVRTDIGRSLIAFAKERYKIDINTEEDMRKFAAKIYNDTRVSQFEDKLQKDYIQDGLEGKAYTRISREVVLGEKSFFRGSVYNHERTSLAELYSITTPGAKPYVSEFASSYEEDTRTINEIAIDRQNGWW